MNKHRQGCLEYLNHWLLTTSADRLLAQEQVFVSLFESALKFNQAPIINRSDLWLNGWLRHTILIAQKTSFVPFIHNYQHNGRYLQPLAMLMVNREGFNRF